jgi:hypothetical protein
VALRLLWLSCSLVTSLLSLVVEASILGIFFSTLVIEVDAALREVLDDARRVADLILRTSRSVTVVVVDISDVCVF